MVGAEEDAEKSICHQNLTSAAKAVLQITHFTARVNAGPSGLQENKKRPGAEACFFEGVVQGPEGPCSLRKATSPIHQRASTPGTPAFGRAGASYGRVFFGPRERGAFRFAGKQEKARG